MLQRRQWLSSLGACAAASCLPAWAQNSASYPQKPVRIIIPYAAGGVTDAVGRSLLERLGKTMGQTFVVENKAGAGGTIGIEQMVRAAPDGYTLALSAISPLTLSPHLMKLSYDPFKDVVAVAPMMYSPVYVMATPAFAGKSWADVIAMARKSPGSLRMATSGIGSVGHIMLEQIKLKAGVDIVHVPYKGVGQTVNDAVGGHFELMFGNPFGTINGLIDQGTLRVLAVSGPQRAPNLPKIATLQELGFPEANITSLFGFFAPGKTPPTIVAQLNAAIQAQLNQEETLALMRRTDNIALHHTPQEFSQILHKESQANQAIIERAKITL